MSKLTLNNAPKATGKVHEDDTVDVTDAQLAEAALEALVEADAQRSPTAGEKLGEFRLTHLARALLDKACVNVSENTGKGLDDPIAKDAAETIASIFAESGHDLSKVIDFTLEAMGEDPQAALGFIYKECYAVQKALNFIGNMAYRRALDPKSDFDLDKFVDYREEEREAPYGLAPIGTWDEERARDNEGTAENGKADHDLILNALEDLHILLQLTVESFGWDAENPMPYGAVLEKDETFRQIHGLEECLDIMEVRYKESRRKRAEKNLEGLRLIQAAARAKLVKTVAKK